MAFVRYHTFQSLLFQISRYFFVFVTDTHNITNHTETLENADLASVPEENVTDSEEIER